MLIRKANKTDIKQIKNFQVEMAYETEDLQLNPETVFKGVENVFIDTTKGQYYVAESEGNVIASLLTTFEWSDWRNATVLWVQSVYVKPEYRGKGVFKRMYNSLKEKVKTDVNYCGIRLYVDRTNHNATKAYNALGMNGEHYDLFEWMK